MTTTVSSTSMACAHDVQHVPGLRSKDSRLGHASVHQERSNPRRGALFPRPRNTAGCQACGHERASFALENSPDSKAGPSTAMSEQVLTALIAATPPTVAAVLGYLANRRSLRRTVGTRPGLPLTKVIERV